MPLFLFQVVIDRDQPLIAVVGSYYLLIIMRFTTCFIAQLVFGSKFSVVKGLNFIRFTLGVLILAIPEV